nr:MAG TPA: hypothetical protein [Bacteriophage sp.]
MIRVYSIMYISIEYSINKMVKNQRYHLYMIDR